VGGVLKLFPLTTSLKSPVYDSYFKIRKSLALTLFVIALLSASAMAQNQHRVDSLRTILDQAPEREKIAALIPLSFEYYDVDNNLALEYAKRAYAIAYEFGDSATIVKSARMMGQLHRRMDELDKSIEVLLPVRSMAKRLKLKDEEKRILNALAIAYTFGANYDEALKYHYESLLIREEDGNKEEISIALNNVGLVYFKMKNHIRALEFFERSLKMKREFNVRTDLDGVLLNIALCYNQLSEFSKAQEYFSEAFKVCGGKCGDPTLMEGEFGLGVSYFGLNNLDEAKVHFLKSYQIAERTGTKRFLAENLIYLSRVYVKQRENELALKTLTQTEEIAGSAGYNEILISTYGEFATLFTHLKNFEKAAYYQARYIGLKDSVYSEELISNLARIQSNYAERENLKVIADKDEVIERQRSLNFAIVIIALLAALLIFVLFRTNRVRKKVNLALSDAKAIIEDQNRQLLSSNYNLDRELKEKNTELQKANESLLRVNDELDNFIYKTSHDIRGPLASLKGMCNVALMDVKDPLALNYLKKLDITAEKLNTILTRLLIVNQINNSALAQDLIDFDTIVNDVLLLEKKKGLPLRLKIRKNIEAGIEYYSDKEFVRIIFENLIDNAIKFYNDSQRVEPFVEITVTQEENYVRIRVIDNGIGISEVHPDKIFQMFSRASERSETGGIGLYITKTATEKLGGSVNLKTSPEGHTEFYVLLPLATSKVMI
jgi:signal transduction histidine kinase